MPPVRNELPNLNRFYFTQDLKYHNEDVFLTTNWFNSSGLKESIDKKMEMLVPMSGENLAVLKSIEETAMRDGLKLPVEFQTSHGIEAIYKRLPAKPNLYIKLHPDASCFDKNCRPIKHDALRMGDFRVIIHVKGLYIGYHPTGKLVSMQLRIAQIQNIPRIPHCMFTPISSATLNNTYQQPTAPVFNVPETPQPGVEAVSLAPNNKKGRKPKLQRQNAVVEAKIQQQEHRKMESIPADFFNDLDLSALASVH